MILLSNTILGEPADRNVACPAKGEVDGLVFNLDLREALHRLVFLDLFDIELRRQVRSLLRPGDTVVDVGANFGFWTLAAAAADCSVIACEPVPTTRELLTKNIAENGLGERITVVADAMSNAIGTLEITLPKGESGHASAHPEPSDDLESFTVATSTLDALIGEQHIRLLKIDVEGHEAAVLAGGATTLTDGRVDYVLIEIVDEHLERAGSSAAEVSDMLKANGFVLHRWISENEGLWPRRRSGPAAPTTLGSGPGDSLWRWQGGRGRA
jgi:FkbM family methyltransferase